MVSHSQQMLTAKSSKETVDRLERLIEAYRKLSDDLRGQVEELEAELEALEPPPVV
jgi:prefoldin subunit 5